MSDIWYYDRNGKPVGPYTLQQLKAELHKIPSWRAEYVWHPGGDWVQAGNVPELAPREAKSIAEFFYESGGVVISGTLARFGNVTYPINGIGSVRVDPPNRRGWIIAGVLLGLLGFISILGARPGEGLNPISLLMIVAGVAFLIGAFNRPHSLMLRTASGDVQAYSSTNRREIEHIKEAIERAVTSRG